MTNDKTHRLTNKKHADSEAYIEYPDIYLGSCLEAGHLILTLIYFHPSQTMYGEYQLLSKMQTDAGYREEFLRYFSYQRFRASWYHFIQLLDISYIDGFTCEQCGELPETVIMDATSISVRKELLSWQNFIRRPRNTCVEEGRY